MTNNLHPQNIGKPAVKLIEQAQDAMLAAINRHFKNDGATGPTIRATIPAQWDDTDVIVMDALRVAKEAAEQRDELLTACKNLVEQCLNQEGDELVIRSLFSAVREARHAIAKAEGGQS